MPDPPAPPNAPLNQDLAKAIVRAHHERLGRGSPRARVFRSDEVLVVVLRDPFTKSEQSLIASGRGAAVIQLRQQIEAMMEAELVEIVERLTGRSVEAFLSTAHITPELVIELFVFHDT
jgi:uncharacterized protein YbcI